MAPVALSILTTTFHEGCDRNTALGVWGAISGLAAAAGVFLGGVLSEGPGWRLVFYVNVPVCALALGAAFRLLSGERKRAPLANFDTPGALLATSGMLLLVYALIKAPAAGWAGTGTIRLLAAAGLALAAFVVNELRSRKPLVDLSIFRIKGLAAADATWLIAMAGFFAMFFFLALYMQEVLGFSPIKGGGRVPSRDRMSGTRSRIPLHCSYAADVLPGLPAGGPHLRLAASAAGLHLRPRRRLDREPHPERCFKFAGARRRRDQQAPRGRPTAAVRRVRGDPERTMDPRRKPAPASRHSIDGDRRERTDEGRQEASGRTGLALDGYYSTTPPTATRTHEGADLIHGSRRVAPVTRSMLLSNDRTVPTPVASACATRYASAKSRRSTS